MKGQKPEYIEGFEWPLPSGFRDALEVCQFGAGDLIYDTPIVYEAEWADALETGFTSYQVLAPSRGPMTKKDGDADSKFVDSWSSEIIVAVKQHPEGETRQLKSTQGRLYTACWKGDSGELDTAGPAPLAPVLAMSLIKSKGGVHKLHESRLESAFPSFGPGLVWAMPYDETRELLRDKRRAVERELKAFSPRRVIHLPEHIGLSDDEPYAPTVRVCIYFMDDADRAEVEQALKRALYKPSPTRKPAQESFALWRHGVLDAVGIA